MTAAEQALVAVSKPRIRMVSPVAGRFRVPAD
jgi:hypothetical protein